MSHEFRTPLNAILGYTHMLLNGVTGAVSDPQRKSLTRIDSNSRHLLALINDILDITRIEAGRMPLNLTTFRVPELVDEVMSELEPIIKRSKLTVTARTRALGAGAEERPAEGQADRPEPAEQRAQVHARGSVTIAASYDGKSRHGRHRRAGHGRRHPGSDQGKVFEDFRQLDSSPARGYGGTGLGLSICRRLSQMLGGTIELDSHQGRGRRSLCGFRPARRR